jgi:serine/threonine protein kinase
VNTSALLGEQLEGRYRVDEYMAKGGMGFVYRGTDLALNRPVAIKFLDARFRSDHDLVVRFRREALWAATLDHPNIIPVYSAGEFSHHAYFVMKYVDGATVSQLIHERGRLPLREAVAIGIQVCDGLEQIHERGFVHRDIKSPNVMVGHRGHAYILDFGISRHVTSNLTQTGFTTGTPEYMSPEQARDGTHIDGRSDLYSVGVMLFEMITGSRPFAADNAFDLLMKHALEPPSHPSAFVPALPPEVDGIVLRALEKDPDRRFASAAEMRAALLTLLPATQLRNAAAARAWLYEQATPAPSDSDRTEPKVEVLESAPHPPLGKRKWMIAAALIVAALLLVVLLPLVLARHEPQPPPTSLPPAPKKEAATAPTPTAAIVQRPSPPLATKPLRATLEVDSTPQGATVFLDNLDVGHTPLHALAVDRGPHDLILRKSGFALYRTHVEVAAGASEAVRAKLKPLMGLLSVAIRDGGEISYAEVILDGRSLGLGPFSERKVRSGAHRIGVRRKGYVARERSIYLRPGGHEKVAFDLKRE